MERLKVKEGPISRHVELKDVEKLLRGDGLNLSDLNHEGQALLAPTVSLRDYIETLAAFDKLRVVIKYCKEED